MTFFSSDSEDGQAMKEA